MRTRTRRTKSWIWPTSTAASFQRLSCTRRSRGGIDRAPPRTKDTKRRTNDTRGTEDTKNCVEDGNAAQRAAEILRCAAVAAARSVHLVRVGGAVGPLDAA